MSLTFDANRACRDLSLVIEQLISYIRATVLWIQEEEPIN